MYIRKYSKYMSACYYLLFKEHFIVYIVRYAFTAPTTSSSSCLFSFVVLHIGHHKYYIVCLHA